MSKYPTVTFILPLPVIWKIKLYCKQWIGHTPHLGCFIDQYMPYWTSSQLENRICIPDGIITLLKAVPTRCTEKQSQTFPKAGSEYLRLVLGLWIGGLSILLLEMLRNDHASVHKPGDIRHIVILRHVNPDQRAHREVERSPYQPHPNRAPYFSRNSPAQHNHTPTPKNHKMPFLF